MPSWHPPDSDSGMIQDDESIIKVHNNAKSRFSWIWPFGIWTTKTRRNQDEELHKLQVGLFLFTYSINCELDIQSENILKFTVVRCDYLP